MFPVLGFFFFKAGVEGVEGGRAVMEGRPGFFYKGRKEEERKRKKRAEEEERKRSSR